MIYIDNRENSNGINWKGHEVMSQTEIKPIVRRLKKR